MIKKSNVSYKQGSRRGGHRGHLSRAQGDRGPGTSIGSSIHCLYWILGPFQMTLSWAQPKLSAALNTICVQVYTELARPLSFAFPL